MILFKKKELAFFLACSDEPLHVYELVRRSGVSYVFGWKFSSELEKRGLVAITVEGNKKFVVLTDLGKQIKNHVNSIKSLLNVEADEQHR